MHSLFLTLFQAKLWFIQSDMREQLQGQLARLGLVNDGTHRSAHPYAPTLEVFLL
jgi:hypothetical protein